MRGTSKLPFPDWTEQPLFFAALSFSAGITLAAGVVVPAWQWALLAVTLLASAILLIVRRRGAAVVVAVAILLPLGALTSTLATAARPQRPDLTGFTAESMEITAHVTATTLPRFDAADRELRTVEVVTETVSDGTTVRDRAVGARLTIHDNGRAIPDVKYGDRIRFVARLREPRNYGNPGAMDYRGYLEGKGIVALASVPSTSIEVLRGQVGTRWGFWRARIRTSVLAHMLSLAQEPCSSWRCMSREDVGVLAAMILGEQSLLERSTKVDFQKTGAFHILVVSGMNVGIVAWVVFWIARRLHASPMWATVFTIALSLFYAYLTDMGAPILRAVVMLALYLCAKLLYRERYSLNSIGTAALILLVAAPAALFAPSFQLTFLSVAALGGIVQPLLERTLLPIGQALRNIGLTGIDTALQPWQAQLRLDLRLLAVKLARVLQFGKTEWVAALLARILRGGIAFAELLIVTATLQIALALPMVWYFHRMALVGVPANIVVVPLTALLMPLGIAATAMTYLFAPAAHALAIASAGTLHVVIATVEWLAGVPRADLRLPMPTIWIALFAAVAYAAALFAFRRTPRIAWIAATALIIAAALLMLPSKPRFRTDAAEITAIDVGQGDSLLVIEPSGKTLLIDGGGPPGFARSDSFDVGEDVVSPYLWSRGIARLDAVLLTHPHSDHMDGLRAVIKNFQPTELWLGTGDSQAFEPLTQTARAAGTSTRVLSSGEKVHFGTLTLDILSSGHEGTENVNDESLVLRASYQGSTMLFLGDAERDLERGIAAHATPVDVLKVAHHGSATSTTPELLAATKPKFAVISVGVNNPYGHPRADVLARLRASGVLTYRTDVNGATSFYLRGSTVSAEDYLQTPPMLPERPRPRPAGSRDTRR